MGVCVGKNCVLEVNEAKPLNIINKNEWVLSSVMETQIPKKNEVTFLVSNSDSKNTFVPTEESENPIDDVSIKEDDHLQHPIQESQTKLSLISDAKSDICSKIKLPHSKLQYIIQIMYNQGFLDQAERSKLKDLVVCSEPRMVKLSENLLSKEKQTDCILSLFSIVES